MNRGAQHKRRPGRHVDSVWLRQEIVAAVGVPTHTAGFLHYIIATAPSSVRPDIDQRWTTCPQKGAAPESARIAGQRAR